jgi:adenylosuccinate synthase
VAKIAADAKISSLDVFYAARAYLTRHGAGSLPFEQASLLYASIHDQTNIKNPFQGVLRFAPFNFDLLKKAIESDLSEAADIKINRHLVVTCMDQIGPEIHYILDERRHAVQKDQFLYEVQKHFPPFKIGSSTGDTREFISLFQEKAGVC